MKYNSTCTFCNKLLSAIKLDRPHKSYIAAGLLIRQYTAHSCPRYDTDGIKIQSEHLTDIDPF